MVLIAVTIENDSIVLCDGDGFSNTQSQLNFFRRTGGILESYSGLLTDKTSSSKNSNVLHNGFAVVSEGGGFDCADFEIILESVEDKSCQKLTLDIFSNDKKRFLFLIGKFQERQNVPDISQFLLHK